LLAVEEELGGGVGRGGLADGEVALGDGLKGFPDEDGAGGVAAIEGIEEVADARGAPDVAALHLGKAEFAALDLGDEFFDGGFGFGHWESAG
jgi:hypothetical protein